VEHAVSAQLPMVTHDDSALSPLLPGQLVPLVHGELLVTVAPEAGGRIVQTTCDGIDWLHGYRPYNSATIAWGCYPMIPWAGRLRRGRFAVRGRQFQLPTNLQGHAIHGLAFARPWIIDKRTTDTLSMRLELPEDTDWPFGGTARQRITLRERRMLLEIEITAGRQPMPCVVGWHPWFQKPAHVDFAATACYPRDDEGIATLPLGPLPRGHWDDCFLNEEPVRLERDGCWLRLSSDCRHWVVYDALPTTTCFEPQSGPPDAFNLEPNQLPAGQSMARWFLWEWELPNVR
jgi:aldose 1-epimerase